MGGLEITSALMEPPPVPEWSVIRLIVVLIVFKDSNVRAGDQRTPSSGEDENDPDGKRLMVQDQSGQ